MAALGKGNSRSAGVRWRRRGVPAAVALAAALLAGSAGPARASQDPLFGAQWALQEIGAPTAWQRSTGAGVRIGIVDSGVFAQQEDLRPGSFTTERSPDEMPRLRRMKVGLRSERLPERRTRGPDQQFRRGGDGT